jgi:hypothetical protein
MASRPSFARRASDVTRAGIARQVSYFARGEKAGLHAVRKVPWVQNLLLALVPAAAVCTSLVPYVMTGETSRRGVEDACKENYLALWSTYDGLAVADADYTYNMELAVESYENTASDRLNPAHTCNTVSTLFSSACFLLWVYFTPHRKPSAFMLDKTRKLRFTILPFTVVWRLPSAFYLPRK